MFDRLRDRFARWNARLVRRLGHGAYFWLAAVVSLGVVLDVYQFHRLSAMQSRIFDTLLALRLEKPRADPDIVIVDIDEASLASLSPEYGRWPWPNQVFGEFLSAIQPQQPRAIVFDILFSDPDVTRPESDRYFNEVVATTRNTWFPMMRLAARNDALSHIRPSQVPGALSLPGATPEDKPVALVLPHVPAALNNGRLGVHNVEPDTDGVIRRGNRYFPHAGWALPSLASAVSLGRPPSEADAQFLINWRGGPYSYRYVSFAEIYRDSLRKNRERPADEFTGKIVLIGSTAPSLFDVKASPLSRIHPGVEMLANMVDNLKNDDYLRTQPPWLTSGACLAFIWLMAWALSRQVRIEVFDGVFTAAQVSFLAVSWASLNFSRHYLDLSAAITFGTVYFAVARIYASQSSHWLANGYLYDLRAGSGQGLLAVLVVRFPARTRKERRLLEREISHLVSLSAQGASRIVNLVEDPGLVRELFDDTVVVYWLAAETALEEVQADRARIETGLTERLVPSGTVPAFHFCHRSLVWEGQDAWRAPMRALVLQSLLETGARCEEGKASSGGETQ